MGPSCRASRAAPNTYLICNLNVKIQKAVPDLGPDQHVCRVMRWRRYYKNLSKNGLHRSNCNYSKLCVNFSQRIRMDSLQSQCSAICSLFKSHVIKLFLILLWTQISNFGHFCHFDFGHKSTQNPGAMPQLWHLTLATCPRICGTSTKITVRYAWAKQN